MQEEAINELKVMSLSPRRENTLELEIIISQR